MKKVLITGSSSGLGLSLCDVFLRNGYEVYGISRSPTLREMSSCVIDFSNQEIIDNSFWKFLKGNNIKDFEYVFLNAGVLGPISKAVDLSLGDLQKCFQINVGASKQILDVLLSNLITLKNVVAISSGAANKSYDGWLAYCLSKAALKQMISCYAEENQDIHFLSLSPGPMKTKMQELLQGEDASKFKSMKRFHDLFPTLDSPDTVAQIIFNNLNHFKMLESGSFHSVK
jgi:benzil reductase ((S)-benzoin forming)